MNYGLISSYLLCLFCLSFLVIFDVKPADAERYFLIERPRLGLDLSFEYEQEMQSGPFIDRKDATYSFKERLEIETKGWVYHPALLIYTIRLSPEWQQLIEKPDTGGERRSKTSLEGYYLDATIFQYKPYTLKLFAQKGSSTLKSSFAQRTEIETDTYGAELFLKYKLLPTTLRYAHFDITQRGFLTSEESSDEVRLSMKNRTKKSWTDVTASYIDRDRAQGGMTTSSEALYGNISNFYTLKGDNKLTLNSSLSGRFSETNLDNSSGYGISETLRWKHSWNLESQYSLSYSEDSFKDYKSKRGSLQVGLSHQLYENLRTSITATTSMSDFTGGSTRSYGGNIDMNYTRRIPWGLLNISMGHGYSITKSDITREYIQIIDEPHVLKIDEITFLNNEHVDINSIIVTNTNHTVVYIKDIDYTITEMGNMVRISRTIFGAIAEGQEVLVSYQYLSNPAFDYSLFNQSYGVNLNLFSSLRLSYRYSHSRQGFISGTMPDTLIDDTTQVAEAEYYREWTDTRLTYEEQDRASGISTKRWAVSESLRFRPRRNIFLSLNGNYGETRFKDTGNTEKFYGINSTAHWLLSSRSRLQLEGFYRKILGAANKVADTGFISLFEWSYGIWTLDISYKFINEKDEIYNKERQYHYALFRIKRRLF